MSPHIGYSSNSAEIWSGSFSYRSIYRLKVDPAYKGCEPVRIS